MRKSFDGLCGVVRDQLHSDPTSGNVFIFINRRRDRIKLLQWEHGGFVLYYKRLESGTFEMPSVEGQVCRMQYADLLCLIEGISLSHIKRRKRYNSTKQCG